jgi:hypothetical protein
MGLEVHLSASGQENTSKGRSAIGSSGERWCVPRCSYCLAPGRVWSHHQRHGPHRGLHLLGGPVGAVGTASLCRTPFWQSPNLWWPEDRAWCVATEIDLMTTYIGASHRCVQAIVEHPGLEAAAVAPSDGITHFSDSVNPPPGQ